MACGVSDSLAALFCVDHLVIANWLVLQLGTVIVRVHIT